MLSLLFLVVTLGAMFFYPMFNEWLYSLWMFITIILWLALCVVICVLFAKQIFNARQNEPIPLDIENFPLITIFTAFSHKELENEYKIEEEKKEAKSPKKSTTKKKSLKTESKKTTKKSETKKEVKKVKEKSAKQKKSTKSKKSLLNMISFIC